MEEIDRLFLNDRKHWNINDRLLTRSIVTGMTEFDFDMNVVYNHIWLCGGQRNERKKWDHWCPSVDVIVWVVSLTSFQEKSIETDMNAMLEALETFNNAVNKPEYTQGKLWFVLFNRMDLFEQALSFKRLATIFPDFNGNPLDLKENVLFIMNKFAACIGPEVHNNTMFVFDYIALIDCIQVKQWIERAWPIIHKFLKAKQKKAFQTP